MRPKIYLFGDSITEQSFDEGGWGASLANHFCRNVDVVVRGYSGYNTRWALMAIEKVFPPPAESCGEAAPLCVTVFFGANDASIPDRHSGNLHVPIDEYKQDLHSIVSFFRGIILNLRGMEEILDKRRAKWTIEEEEQGAVDFFGKDKKEWPNWERRII